MVRSGLGTRVSDLWVFLIGSGLRIGEALALRPCDVDLVACTVTVAGTITQRPKLERKDHDKSGTSGQVVPISKATAEALKRILKYRRINAEAETIFTNRDGRLWSPDSFDHALRRAGEAAGLDSKLT